jgi:RNA polymerase sigma factor (sigma-70 family)
MNQQPLDDLLDKLNAGDPATVEQTFRTYEGYLRMMVRRRLPAKLRSKFDSTDIVQSVWADLLTRFRSANYRFADAAHLRAFLVKVTRNRFLDRVRRQQPALRHEQPLGDRDLDSVAASAQARPSEIAKAEELWQRMLALCPPAHRHLLDCKRRGMSLAEIAGRTGLHESSVRRILYDLARRMLGDLQRRTKAPEQGE